jgi:hypothetical protein
MVTKDLVARAREQYPTMRNRAMARKLTSGEALDVRTMLIGVVRPQMAGPIETGDYEYELSRYQDGKDYCDAALERWIWSIGKSLEDGRILAATDTRFYQHDDFECLWLR